MELLKKFDAQNYKDTTSVFEKYTIRGIIVRDGKIAMQCSKEGEYKIPGGGMEAGETYVEALAREVKEETGLFIIPEKAVGLGEILEVRKDIFDDTKKFICHSLFYYCEETGEETPIHLTKSEIAKGYYLKWATPQEIYDTNIAMEKDPWIIRDTAFIKMILDGKIAALAGQAVQIAAAETVTDQNRRRGGYARHRHKGEIAERNDDLVYQTAARSPRRG